jgi:hypothetical protein
MGVHPWQRGLVHVADLHELTSRVLLRRMLTRALLQLAYRGNQAASDESSEMARCSPKFNHVGEFRWWGRSHMGPFTVHPYPAP